MIMSHRSKTLEIIFLMISMRYGLHCLNCGSSAGIHILNYSFGNLGLLHTLCGWEIGLFVAEWVKNGERAGKRIAFLPHSAFSHWLIS
jgi:hypothetical protein